MPSLRQTSLLAASILMALSLAACKREQPVADAGTPAVTADATPAAEPVPAIELEDVVERDPRYLIGIAYPPLAKKYPQLAQVVKDYADAARADLLGAIDAVGEHASDGMLYDLSLEFRDVLDSERFAAVAAAGGLYTGGAHAMPLVGRWVWLPQRNEMLTAQKLVPGGDWDSIAAHVREQLQLALAQRVKADKLDPDVGSDVLRRGGRMIDEGTKAEADNFEQFEPVPGADGRLAALRFVFPPYQVGPYSDGEQSAEVPAAVLLPHIAPEYRDLFEGG